MRRIILANRIVMLCLLAVGLSAGSVAAQSPGTTQAAEGNANQTWKGLFRQKAEQQLSQAKQQLKDATAAMDRLRSDQAALKDQYQMAIRRQDQMGVSSDSFPEVIRSLQTQRVDLMIDLAGLEARQVRLLEMQERAKEDQIKAVVAPLERMLEMSRQNVAEVEKMTKGGFESSARLREAKMKMLDLEMQIAQAKQSAGPDLMSGGLLELALDKAEKEARLEKVQELLGTTVKSREAIWYGEETKDRLSKIRQELLLQERKSDAIRASMQKYLEQMEASKQKEGEDH